MSLVTKLLYFFKSLIWKVCLNFVRVVQRMADMLERKSVLSFLPLFVLSWLILAKATVWATFLSYHRRFNHLSLFDFLYVISFFCLFFVNAQMWIVLPIVPLANKMNNSRSSGVSFRFNTVNHNCVVLLGTTFYIQKEFVFFLELHFFMYKIYCK